MSVRQLRTKGILALLDESDYPYGSGPGLLSLAASTDGPLDSSTQYASPRGAATPDMSRITEEPSRYSGILSQEGSNDLLSPEGSYVPKKMAVSSLNGFTLGQSAKDIPSTPNQVDAFSDWSSQPGSSRVIPNFSLTSIDGSINNADGPPRVEAQRSQSPVPFLVDHSPQSMPPKSPEYKFIPLKEFSSQVKPKKMAQDSHSSLEDSLSKTTIRLTEHGETRVENIAEARGKGSRRRMSNLDRMSVGLARRTSTELLYMMKNGHAYTQYMDGSDDKSNEPKGQNGQDELNSYLANLDVSKKRRRSKNPSPMTVSFDIVSEDSQPIIGRSPVGKFIPGFGKVTDEIVLNRSTATTRPLFQSKEDDPEAILHGQNLANDNDVNATPSPRKRKDDPNSAWDIPPPVVDQESIYRTQHSVETFADLRRNVGSKMRLQSCATCVFTQNPPTVVPGAGTVSESEINLFAEANECGVSPAFVGTLYEALNKERLGKSSDRLPFSRIENLFKKNSKSLGLFHVLAEKSDLLFALFRTLTQDKNRGDSEVEPHVSFRVFFQAFIKMIWQERPDYKFKLARAGLKYVEDDITSQTNPVMVTREQIEREYRRLGWDPTGVMASVFLSETWSKLNVDHRERVHLKEYMDYLLWTNDSKNYFEDSDSGDDATSAHTLRKYFIHVFSQVRFDMGWSSFSRPWLSEDTWKSLDRDRIFVLLREIGVSVKSLFVKRSVDRFLSKVLPSDKESVDILTIVWAVTPHNWLRVQKNIAKEQHRLRMKQVTAVGGDSSSEDEEERSISFKRSMLILQYQIQLDEAGKSASTPAKSRNRSRRPSLGRMGGMPGRKNSINLAAQIDESQTQSGPPPPPKNNNLKLPVIYPHIGYDASRDKRAEWAQRPRSGSRMFDSSTDLLADVSLGGAEPAKNTRRASLALSHQSSYGSAS